MDFQDYAQAEKYFKQGLQWFQEIGDAWGIAISCWHLGKAALLSQDYKKATNWLQQSLSYHKRSGQRSQHYYETLHDVSRLFAAQGRQEDAVEILVLLQYKSHHPYVRDLANTSLVELQAALPADIYTAAVERRKSLDLDTIIADFLAPSA